MVWSGIAGSLAAYVALVGGSLSLLGFGVDAVIDSISSVALIWADAVAAIVVALILAREGLASMGAAEPEGDAPVAR